MYLQLQQQCPGIPPISLDINCSVSGPDTSSTDHPGLDSGPGLLPSSDNWLTPQCRQWNSTGHTDSTSNTVPVRSNQDGRDHSSLLSTKICRPYQSVSFTPRTGWASSPPGVASTQQCCHYSTELNSKDSCISGPSYYPTRPAPEPVCDGMGGALLVDTSELSSFSHHGLLEGGVGCVGGGRARARGRVRSEVSGSCTAPQINNSNIHCFSSAGVPVTS